MDFNKKQHWDEVYTTKTPEQVSWTQKVPNISLKLIANLSLPKESNIIDIGGGDSNLVDFLLEEGYQNISVLDISEKAISKAKIRLGDKASKVNWIVSDVLDFKPEKNYDLWHDRAAFHFLTNKNEIGHYAETIKRYVTKGLIIATFSTEGPLKCSGLNITQYSENTLLNLFQNDFKITECITDEHITPFNTTQNFLYCSFKRNTLI